MAFQCRFWFLLATGHLVVVMCGAGYLLPEDHLGSVGRTIRWYGTMSGASSSYGFFAPQVGAQHRAKFLLRDEKGATLWEVFDKASSPEARLRLTGIVEEPFMSGKAEELPQLRQRLVKSWAATMFTRHPSAESLTAVVEFLDIPTIAEYRAGSRPNWETVYRAEIQRQSTPASGMVP